MIEKILNGEITEYVFNTKESLDNYWSMDYFIKTYNLIDLITLHEGTYIELNDTIGCYSGGRGDFYSHIITFEKL